MFGAGIPVIVGDALNDIFGTSPDLVVYAADIFTYNTDTKKVKPSKESDGNEVGSPGSNCQAGN